MNEIYYFDTKRENTFAKLAAVFKFIAFAFVVINYILMMAYTVNFSSFFPVSTDTVVFVYSFVTDIILMVYLSKKKRTDKYFIIEIGAIAVAFMMWIFETTFTGGKVFGMDALRVLTIVYLIMCKYFTSPKYRSMLSKLCFVPFFVGVGMWLVMTAGLRLTNKIHFGLYFILNCMPVLTNALYSLFLCLFMSPYVTMCKKVVTTDGSNEGTTCEPQTQTEEKEQAQEQEIKQ